MAARAAARTLAGIKEGPERSAGGVAFANVLAGGPLPSGALEESLILLDASAGSVVLRNLLARQSLPPFVLRSALEVAGRLKLRGLAPEVAHWVGHNDSEVGAAAMRALWKLGLIPTETAGLVVAALEHSSDFVRVQATHAVSLLDPEVVVPLLWERLGDRSWWVRRAAAESLLHLSEPGIEQLQAAARSHPDRYARDMATQALADSDVATTDQAAAGASAL